jgi:putative membrane protein
VTVGPVERMLRLASVRIHTVTGPVTAMLPVADRTDAVAFFERLADEAVEQGAGDTSHHWGARVRTESSDAH